MSELNNYEWLKHVLGHCMCATTDTNCWYWSTLQELRKDQPDKDMVDQLLETLQEQAITAKIDALVNEARIDELESVYIEGFLKHNCGSHSLTVYRKTNTKRMIIMTKEERIAELKGK